jgi:hypothetical protein
MAQAPYLAAKVLAEALGPTWEVAAAAGLELLAEMAQVRK